MEGRKLQLNAISQVKWLLTRRALVSITQTSQLMFLTLYTAGVYTDSEFKEMWYSNSVLSQKNANSK